ncbi:MAG: hypothetical protein A3G80_11005 [Betaproteobacteria bacterium RIFCSPLOWO2_12_FULL_62_13b]|nr:MAG: hypothetical protein A3G80_11005 [Betaproteobacteria bacterium RIFCSPLOWO2_12_FULL_62_13b]
MVRSMAFQFAGAGLWRSNDWHYLAAALRERWRSRLEAHAVQTMHAPRVCRIAHSGRAADHAARGAMGVLPDRGQPIALGPHARAQQVVAKGITQTRRDGT